MAALFFPSAISRKCVALARRQLVRRGLVARPLLDEGFDDPGVDHGAARCDRADCADELVDVLHPLLEEVSATRTTAIEECEERSSDSRTG